MYKNIKDLYAWYGSAAWFQHCKSKKFTQLSCLQFKFTSVTTITSYWRHFLKCYSSIL